MVILVIKNKMILAKTWWFLQKNMVVLAKKHGDPCKKRYADFAI